MNYWYNHFDKFKNSDVRGFIVFYNIIEDFDFMLKCVFFMVGFIDYGLDILVKSLLSVSTFLIKLLYLKNIIKNKK